MCNLIKGGSLALAVLLTLMSFMLIFIEKSSEIEPSKALQFAIGALALLTAIAFGFQARREKKIDLVNPVLVVIWLVIALKYFAL
ncbi:MAG: hypothetical protein A3H67_02425 [Candidatus Buchananbacteria bacterium RIFCSPLOWO2_02_FULL_46_11b]|uniref:Uncharacterized protein n=1 Tax=Candidatus Buchananbacteria bacterium RIFCSPLOWO2_02_FULL_46_11b TaxID=1797548 RepID=A0A1G1YYM7_9BACT|nr:MAG: hypothetical protein A3H67_02425 [Candidatus Buchananbacteria bacterium RIFCSPLOWO2_02_FULL_46_11b]